MTRHSILAVSKEAIIANVIPKWFVADYLDHVSDALGFALDINGSVEAVAGLHIVDGFKIAFFDCSEVAKSHPITLARFAKFSLRLADCNAPVLAFQDQAQESSSRFLKYLGFRPIDTVSRNVWEYGGVS